MVDRDAIEKALLLGVVKESKWNILILNDITELYFSYANRALFRYIKEYVNRDEYPTLQILCFEFKIDDQSLQEYLSVGDLQSLCSVLKKEYLKENLKYQLSALNEYSNEMDTDPIKYVDRLGNVYNDLKLIGYQNRTVGLFDNIEQILTIDPTDVISTGFKELDQKLIGWKRGEELAIFMARTGQGKSWMGLKFALSAALQGERVGIYSGEMSTQQLQERILCCGKQNYTDSKDDAMKFLLGKDLTIRTLTQKELRRRANVNDIEEMIVRDKLTMVVIDQLSLMDDVTSKPGTPLRQQYGNISMDLFTLTSRYNCPIILLVQSNRQGSQDQNGPGLENIAESDAVAQNATRVISMRNEAGILTMRILKNRYGESDMIQKYEVDFGINKYKPIKEYDPQVSAMKRSQAKTIFGGPSRSTF